MRIGIDAVTVGESLLPAASGMRVYATALVRAMAMADATNEIVVFETPYIDLDELDGIPNVRRIRCYGAPRNRSLRVVYQNSIYPGLLRAAGLDVFLATANVLPFGLRIPSVVVVQGLQWFTNPPAFGQVRGSYLRAAARDAAHRARSLVAVSNVARHDAITYLDVPETKIHVIHHGISEPMQQWAQALHHASEGADPYVLNVATLYHHKNQLRLIDAFAAMRYGWQLKHRLRIIGAESDLTQSDLCHHAQKAGVAEFVDLVGPVDHAEIGQHYANADLFVYPSTYETFGFPPLEAMVAGCPVVAANSSSIPEIVGNAALLVDPTDVGAMASAMASVLTNSSLRKSLVSNGTRRVKDFSWARAAHSYIELLQGAVHEDA